MKDVLAALRGDTTSAAVFLATVIVTVTLFWWLNRDPPLPARAQKAEQEPPRNFTLEQLKVRMSMRYRAADPNPPLTTILGPSHHQAFTGKDGPDDPIYVALQGEVFDVSEARDFYGPEGCYGGFAGHDVTKAFALNSLEEKDLDVTE